MTSSTTMKYKEGTGWPGYFLGRATASLNCTDFHCLFILMACGTKIPAKFELSIPTDPVGPAGYHCWAWFLDWTWIPVDISRRTAIRK